MRPERVHLVFTGASLSEARRSRRTMNEAHLPALLAFDHSFTSIDRWWLIVGWLRSAPPALLDSSLP